MSSTFMRGLKLLETIELHGSVTVTELARLTGHDKSVVSRMLSACEPDGWIIRENGRISLGPRAALLGQTSATAEFVRQSASVVETISGVTGMLAQSYALIGSRAVVVAAAGGGQRMTTGLGTSTPLFATAAGTAVAAQLSRTELDALLPPNPFPDAVLDMAANPGYRNFTASQFVSSASAIAETGQLPRNRAELDLTLAELKRGGFAIDRGYLHPELGCIAVPWPRPGLRAALACMGSPGELAGREGQLVAVLAAAAAPGATREQVVAAAAAAAAASTTSSE